MRYEVIVARITNNIEYSLQAKFHFVDRSDLAFIKKRIPEGGFVEVVIVKEKVEYLVYP